MNKLAIPAILVATVMVAGIFAFMPVNEASTVHTTGTMTLANDAITNLKIANDAIGATEVANGAIDAATFAAGAIDAAAVANDSEPFALSVTTIDNDLTTAPTCTSNKPFILEVSAFGANTQTLTISDGANDFVYVFITGALNKHITLAGDAGQIWTLTGNNAGVDAIMTIHTQEGATAECNA